MLREDPYYQVIPKKYEAHKLQNAICIPIGLIFDSDTCPIHIKYVWIYGKSNKKTMLLSDILWIG